MTPRVSARADSRQLAAPLSLSQGESHRGCSVQGAFSRPTFPTTVMDRPSMRPATDHRAALRGGEKGRVARPSRCAAGACSRGG